MKPDTTALQRLKLILILQNTPLLLTIATTHMLFYANFSFHFLNKFVKISLSLIVQVVYRYS